MTYNQICGISEVYLLDDKKIDYQNLKNCTQSSNQFPTYLLKVPLLFAYLFFLQSNYLVQIIRV